MTPIQPEPLTCALCNRTAPDVRVGLIRYNQVKDGRVSVYFGTDPRCEDRAACRERADHQPTPPHVA